MAELFAIDLGLTWVDSMSVHNIIIASASKVATSCLLNSNCINHTYLDIVNKCRERQSWQRLNHCMKVNQHVVQINHDLDEAYSKLNQIDQFFYHISSQSHLISGFGV